jgi:hypothetical protein
MFPSSVQAVLDKAPFAAFQFDQVFAWKSDKASSMIRSDWLCP